jgi:hypothetical protein
MKTWTAADIVISIGAANCLVTSLGANATQLDTARPLFPDVADADFATYVVPATGHGINFRQSLSIVHSLLVY